MFNQVVWLLGSALGYSVVKGGVHRYEWATCRVRTSTVFVHSVGMLAMGNSPCSPCAHPKPTNQQLNTRLVPSHDGPSRHPSETSWPHAMGDVTARALTLRATTPRRGSLYQGVHCTTAFLNIEEGSPSALQIRFATQDSGLQPVDWVTPLQVHSTGAAHTDIPVAATPTSVGEGASCWECCYDHRRGTTGVWQLLRYDTSALSSSGI